MLKERPMLFLDDDLKVRVKLGLMYYIYRLIYGWPLYYSSGSFLFVFSKYFIQRVLPTIHTISKPKKYFVFFFYLFWFSQKNHCQFTGDK